MSDQTAKSQAKQAKYEIADHRTADTQTGADQDGDRERRPSATRLRSPLVETGPLEIGAGLPELGELAERVVERYGILGGGA